LKSTPWSASSCAPSSTLQTVKRSSMSGVHHSRKKALPIGAAD
jgi:hypothetical protein